VGSRQGNEHLAKHGVDFDDAIAVFDARGRCMSSIPAAIARHDIGPSGR